MKPAEWQTLAEGLAVLCGVFLLGLVIAASRARKLAARLNDETFRRQSLSTTYGRITEQWFPLMDAYPYDPQNFRFLGSPLDGVQFEDDRIVFVEFKTNRSRLSEKQKKLKQLIEDGYVYWEEIRFEAERE